jgi:hypothetical protein
MACIQRTSNEQRATAHFSSALAGLTSGSVYPRLVGTRPNEPKYNSTTMAKKDGGGDKLATALCDANNSNASGQSRPIETSSLREEAKSSHDVTRSAKQSNVNQDKRGTTSADNDVDNDPEVILLTKFRLALGSTLRMLECARDDLVRLGERMDRLMVASRECRERLEGHQQPQTSGEGSGSNKDC